MLLFAVTLTIALGGLLAIEFAQPSRPRDFAVWNDDTERRYLNEAARPSRW